MTIMTDYKATLVIISRALRLQRSHFRPERDVQQDGDKRAAGGRLVAVGAGGIKDGMGNKDESGVTAMSSHSNESSGDLKRNRLLVLVGVLNEARCVRADPVTAVAWTRVIRRTDWSETNGIRAWGRVI